MRRREGSSRPSCGDPLPSLPSPSVKYSGEHGGRCAGAVVTADQRLPASALASTMSFSFTRRSALVRPVRRLGRGPECNS